MELLRHKALIAGRRIPGAGGTWRAAAPLNAWLDENVGRSALAPEGRWSRR
jgi:hypothetical protein